MRNLGFLSGLALGYMLFTEDGKKLSKKFLGTINDSTEKAIEAGKEILKDAMPETTKIIEEE